MPDTKLREWAREHCNYSERDWHKDGKTCAACIYLIDAGESLIRQCAEIARQEKSAESGGIHHWYNLGCDDSAEAILGYYGIGEGK